MAAMCFSGQSFSHNVIAFGDSITSGYYRDSSGHVSTTGCGDGRKCGGAIPILESYMDNQIEPSNVYNWGWPGEKTGSAGHGSPGGIYRLPAVLATGSKGDYVLLMEGLNDIIHYLSNGDIINNMETMIEITQAKNMVPILGLTTPNSINNHWYITGRSIINPHLAAMADRVGVPWVDHWRNIAINSNWDSNHSGDKLHLNNSGNRIVAQGWLAAIKEHLEEAAKLKEEQEEEQEDDILDLIIPLLSR